MLEGVPGGLLSINNQHDRLVYMWTPQSEQTTPLWGDDLGTFSVVD